MREIPKEQIEQMMQQVGIDPEQERIRTEMWHMVRLVVDQHLTIGEALATIQDTQLRQTLRIPTYATFLRSMVRVWIQEEGRISSEQAEEIDAFLCEIGYPDIIGS